MHASPADAARPSPLGRFRRPVVAVLGLAGAVAALLATAPAALLGDDPAPARPADSPMISHSVFFTLHQSTATGRAELTAACQKYLTGHEGVAYFAVGPRGEQFTREVNDKTFDVSLLVVFESEAAHDLYQDHPRHLEFIAEQKANWQTVRVFDAVVDAAK